MKKVSQAGTVAKQEPGMTSQTGTNVLHRTAINTPSNESAIRGIIHAENLTFLRGVFGQQLDTLIADGDVQVV